MDFFEEWQQNLENMKYFHAFLSDKEYVTAVLKEGTMQEEEVACKVLGSIPLERFIDCICRLRPKHDFEKGDVPIFSNFERSVIRVPELLAFAPEGLTFCQLGYQLMQCENEVAQKKYGENQSKLAALCGLVEIEGRKSRQARKVRLTSLGRYLVGVSLAEKEGIFKRLFLRNAYLQYLISQAALGPISYKDTVSCLAPSNQKRRGGNVRTLMEFICKGSKREQLFRNIDWKV